MGTCLCDSLEYSNNAIVCVFYARLQFRQFEQSNIAEHKYNAFTIGTVAERFGCHLADVFAETL